MAWIEQAEGRGEGEGKGKGKGEGLSHKKTLEGDTDDDVGDDE